MNANDQDSPDRTRPITAARRESDREKRGSPGGKHRPGPWLGLVFLPVWLALFTLGLTVNTKPLLARYNPEFPNAAELVAQGGEAGAPSPAMDMLVLLLCYTPTNAAILCILAGLLGVFGAQVRLGADDGEQFVRDSTHPFISGLLRGFFVYLVLLSGMLIVSGDPFGDLNPSGYVRLAGLVSAISFALNYSPAAFSELLGRVLGLVARAEKERVVQGRRDTVTISAKHVEYANSPHAPSPGATERLER